MYSRRRKRIRTLGTPSLVREEKGPEVDQGGLEIRRPFSRETSGSNPPHSASEPFPLRQN